MLGSDGHPSGPRACRAVYARVDDFKTSPLAAIPDDVLSQVLLFLELPELALCQSVARHVQRLSKKAGRLHRECSLRLPSAVANADRETIRGLARLCPLLEHFPLLTLHDQRLEIVFQLRDQFKTPLKSVGTCSLDMVAPIEQIYALVPDQRSFSFPETLPSGAYLTKFLKLFGAFPGVRRGQLEELDLNFQRPAARSCFGEDLPRLLHASESTLVSLWLFQPTSHELDTVTEFLKSMPALRKLGVEEVTVEHGSALASLLGHPAIGELDSLSLVDVRLASLEPVPIALKDLQTLHLLGEVLPESLARVLQQNRPALHELRFSPSPHFKDHCELLTPLMGSLRSLCLELEAGHDDLVSPILDWLTAVRPPLLRLRVLLPDDHGPAHSVPLDSARAMAPVTAGLGLLVLDSPIAVRSIADLESLLDDLVPWSRQRLDFRLALSMPSGLLSALDDVAARREGRQVASRVANDGFPTLGTTGLLVLTPNFAMLPPPAAAVAVPAAAAAAPHAHQSPPNDAYSELLRILTGCTSGGLSPAEGPQQFSSPLPAHPLLPLPRLADAPGSTASLARTTPMLHSAALDESGKSPLATTLQPPGTPVADDSRLAAQGPPPPAALARERAARQLAQQLSAAQFADVECTITRVRGSQPFCVNFAPT